jgi:LysM repeat protein
VNERRRIPLPPLIIGALVLCLAGWSLWPVEPAGANTGDRAGTIAADSGTVPLVRFVDDASPPAPTATPRRPEAGPVIHLPGALTPGGSDRAARAAEATAGKPDEVLTPLGASATPPVAGPAPSIDVQVEPGEAGGPRPSAIDPLLAQSATTRPAALTPPEAEPKPTAQPAAREAAGEGDAAVAAAVRKFETGQRLAARAELNRMLRSTRDEAAAVRIRSELGRMNEQLFFSPEIEPGDPLFDSYKLGPGEVLAKVSKRFSVPPEIIMRVNGIKDPRRLKAGQLLKAPRGPFECRIDRSEFRLDLYLGDTYIRSFPVGLGKDRGTPTGKWQVVDRLKDPTYYPPENSPIKKVMPPGPQNPLGRFWIALKGLEGDAVGKEGFGIHGTNEPETIGKAESLGCVRMHAADIELLFGALQPGKSIVVIEP